jgi:hypothetical protein
MITQTRIPELVDFALTELPRMRLPDGMWCLEIRADDMRLRGRSIRYSVIAALGMLRAKAAGYEVDCDLEELVDSLLASSDDPSLTPGDLGLMLWLDRRAGRDRAGDLLNALDRRLPDGLSSLEGMEVAWIAIGASECAATGVNGPARRWSDAARTQLVRSNRGPSGLLFHRGSGPRRRLANFATEIYGTLALAKIGWREDVEAVTAARRVADALLALQREDGGWPWIFDVQRAQVVEPYQLYTVHQDAMAPMALLELHEVCDDDRYRAAAVRGIDWIYGRNDLQVPLRDPHRPILSRSIRRRPPWNRAMLYANAAAALGGLSWRANCHDCLEINRTDRPYHLGWVLEAWCGREQLGSYGAQKR